MTVQVKITANGRISLPANVRKRLGLEGGGAILLEETPDGVILRTVAQAIARAQDIARKYADRPGANVEAFLEDRREDSGA